MYVCVSHFHEPTSSHQSIPSRFTALRSALMHVDCTQHPSRHVLSSFTPPLPSQIEVPEARCAKLPRDFEQKSMRKGFRRYWSPVIRRHLSDLDAAEEKLAGAQKDQMRKVFKRFDDKAAVWQKVVRCVSVLDALMSLASVSSSPGYIRPEIVDPYTSSSSSSPSSFLDLVQGRHPTLEMSMPAGVSFIPNTIRLGHSTSSSNSNSSMNDDNVSSNSSSPPTPPTPSTILLSGPNMGGKSTLLRTACVIVILAQIGCFVPADSCALTPVDRIFTRLGASDRILQGQSTFYVELAECAAILHAATSRSLVICDGESQRRRGGGMCLALLLSTPRCIRCIPHL